MSRIRNLLKRLARQCSGVAMTEFALSMPFLLTAGLWGVETANFAVTKMKISQMAAQLADNASRIGDTSTLENRKIYESDIYDLLLGATIQGGNSFALYDHGRVIVSSLEVVPDTKNQQYIHWQRCMGAKEWTSSYGIQGDGTNGGLAGMGPAGEEVFAFEGEAVTFVEVAYDYQPLISERFVGTPVVQAIASFTVRSDRDLRQIYQRDPGSPDPVASCAVFDNPFSPTPAGGGSSSGGSSGGSSSGSSSGGSSSSSSGGSGSSSTSSSTSGGSTSSTSGGATSTSSSTTSGGSSSWGGGSSSWGGGTSGGSSSWGGGSSSWGGGTSGGSSSRGGGTSGGSSSRGGGRWP